MNWNLKRALKRRMPTDAEMEAMGCRYLTAEELDAIFGGRPDDGDINDACPPGGNFGGGYSGGSSSGDSSDSGSSGSFSGDSSSGDNGGQSDASGNSSNSDNSSSKDYSIQPGDTLAGITHDHYPDLTGQDFVDKVNEIAAANGIDNIDNIQAGATISIPGGSGGSSSSGASGASGVGGGGNEHGGNDGEQAGATGTSGNTSGKSGKGASGVGTSTTPATPSQATPQQASEAKGAANGKGKSSGGVKGWFDEKVGAFGKNFADGFNKAKSFYDNPVGAITKGLTDAYNGIKSFVEDPIGTVKGWFGGSSGTTSSNNSAKSFQEQELERFVEKARDLRGKGYEEAGMCNGSLINSLNDMGYNIPLKSADDISKGAIPGIEKYKDVDNARQGMPGVINGYDWPGADGKKDGIIDHINIGVGKQGSETKNQIIDATSSDAGWTARRNSYMPDNGQVYPASPGYVNQTYEPFSTNSTPDVQLHIDFASLPRIP